MGNTPLELIKAVHSFSNIMFKRLLDNVHKSHWSEEPCNRKFLLDELDKRLVSLKQIYPDSNTPVDEFSEKCADIANFAMMLSDNYQKRRYDINGEFDNISDGQPY